jgi:hypothetical protein
MLPSASTLASFVGTTATLSSCCTLSGDGALRVAGFSSERMAGVVPVRRQRQDETRTRRNGPVNSSDMSSPGYGGGSVARRRSLTRFRRRRRKSRSSAEARKARPPTVPPAIAPTGVLWVFLDRSMVRAESEVGCGVCVAS